MAVSGSTTRLRSLSQAAIEKLSQCFFAIVFSLFCSNTLAADLIRESSWLEDPRGDMTLEQVRQGTFSPAGKVLSLGYTRSAIWVRFTFDDSGPQQDLVLSVLPATLDDVRLYYPDGRSVKLSRRLNWIDHQPDRTPLYLRVQSNGSMLISLSLMAYSDLKEDEIDRSLVLGIFLGCFVFSLGVMLLMMLTNRERLHLYSILHIVVLGLTYLNAFGFLQDYQRYTQVFGTPAVGNFLIVANGFLTILILGSLLDAMGMPAWGRRTFRVILGLYAPLLPLLFLVDRQAILFLGVLAMALVSVISIPITVIVFRRRRSGRWLVASLLILSMLNSLRVSLYLLGLLQPSEWIVNMLAFRSATMMATLIALMWLINIRQQEALGHSMLGEMESRQRAAHEKSIREVMERLMMMLLHEFKNPLSVIQLAATSLGRRLQNDREQSARIVNIQRAVDDLNAIVERCVQADQMALGLMPMKKSRFALAATLDDLVRSLDANRIRITVPAGIELLADPHYFRMILLNLLGNALKYSPPDSTVELTVDGAPEGDAGSINLTVSNQVGRAGRPDPAQLFSRYYRADGARGQAGAGLGLWLSQSVATQMGSRIHFTGEQSRVAFNFRMERA
ncbi:7TM-DISM domain-containing protein [Lacisediminimonas sp.]|uniref:sensor histidine kinase n=1 Tax=Lacisediminimonas sp. TaxID=3060582 RepID=UPI00271BBB2D|nr:7TM-DISM domain-containing protein [Lacisediminimonas sp.]MDO8300704.1 7TM-DISM domain-containing protein [Lacisediminimonas sp.]